MPDLAKRRAELEKKKKALESKKKKWLTDIKYQMEQMELFLGKMERQPFTLDYRHGPYYKNDFTGDLEHHLKKMKEIFKEAVEEEHALVREEEDLESDEEFEKRANISLANIIRNTVNGIKNKSE